MCRIWIYMSSWLNSSVLFQRVACECDWNLFDFMRIQISTGLCGFDRTRKYIKTSRKIRKFYFTKFIRGHNACMPADSPPPMLEITPFRFEILLQFAKVFCETDDLFLVVKIWWHPCKNFRHYRPPFPMLFDITPLPPHVWRKYLRKKCYKM